MSLQSALSDTKSFVPTTDDDFLEHGIVKQLTGGDTFYTRDVNYVPHFRLIFPVSGLPFLIDDPGTNRFFIIPFTSSWEDEESPSEASKGKTTSKG
jgi:hypothetical protein